MSPAAAAAPAIQQRMWSPPLRRGINRFGIFLHPICHITVLRQAANSGAGHGWGPSISQNSSRNYSCQHRALKKPPVHTEVRKIRVIASNTAAADSSANFQR